MLKAQQLLADSETLFANAVKHDETMRGVVRIAVPWLPHKNEIIAKLARKVADFPDISIDWWADSHKLDSVGAQVDMGVWICTTATPSLAC